MKISSSTVQMAAEYNAWEGSGEQLALRGGRTLEARTLAAGQPLLARAAGTIIDSVSLQSGTAGEVASTYGYAMHGDARVSRAGDDRPDAMVRESMVQNLVSGVVGQQVTLTRVEGSVTGVPVVTSAWSAVVQPGRLEPVAWVRETLVHYESEQVGFSARGQVETHDGRRIDFQLDLSMDRSLSVKSLEDRVIRQSPAVMTDPLVISLDGRVPELTDTRFEFDLDSDGDQEEISFVSKGSGFLAFDKNGDGRINDGSELFGPASGDGFTDLSVHDLDSNGWIDENDAVFDQLSVWIRDDEGHGTLISLKEAGVGAIFLGAAATPFELKTGQGETKGQVAASGVFLFEDGGVGAVQQIDLAVGNGAPPKADITVRDDDILPLKLWEPVNPHVISAGGFFNDGSFSNEPYKELQDAIETLRKEIRQLLENQGEDPQT